MSGSIEGAVGARLAIKTAMMLQEKDNTLLKQVLEGTENTILSLVNSAVATGPQPLATGGMVGTKLHVTA